MLITCVKLVNLKDLSLILFDIVLLFENQVLEIEVGAHGEYLLIWRKYEISEMV